jgi:hypothetical protein
VAARRSHAEGGQHLVEVVRNDIEEPQHDGVRIPGFRWSKRADRGPAGARRTGLHAGRWIDLELQAAGRALSLAPAATQRRGRAARVSDTTATIAQSPLERGNAMTRAGAVHGGAVAPIGDFKSRCQKTQGALRKSRASRPIRSGRRTSSCLSASRAQPHAPSER